MSSVKVIIAFLFSYSSAIMMGQSNITMSQPDFSLADKFSCAFLS